MTGKTKGIVPYICVVVQSETVQQVEIRVCLGIPRFAGNVPTLAEGQSSSPLRHQSESKALLHTERIYSASATDSHQPPSATHGTGKSQRRSFLMLGPQPSVPRLCLLHHAPLSIPTLQSHTLVRKTLLQELL